jgi:DNA polymerase-1
MKKALVIMFAEFKRLGLQVLPLLNVHDEVQLSTKPEESKNVGRIAAQSIAEAGEYFGLRCPLAGDYDIGQSWAETH